jgi:hypothetical protein
MPISIQAPHHRQETNTKSKGDQEVTSICVRWWGGGGGVVVRESACVCVCGRECVCVCVGERERERVCVCVSAVCGVILYTLVSFFLSYHVPYMFLFVLSLVRVRGVRSHKTCSTPPHIRVVVQSQEPHRH